MDETQALLALHLTGVVGPRRLKAAREAFADLSGLFGAAEERLANLPDWTPACARKVLALEDPLERVSRELDEAARNGIDVLVEGGEGYPAVFKDLYDPPFVLWRKGSYLPEDEWAVAVIGCRKPSPYGRSVAHRFAEDIARAGYTVVSGLARGIDSAAHQGALKHPTGRSLAFLGSGLLNLYPPENRDLAGAVAERGALFSEYPLRARPLSMHFPQRNRLISGSSKGVLVVEARKDSGSFITVDHALDQGKPVFAVPGPVNHIESEGTHTLIQQGAKLAIRAEDLFHEFQDRRAESVLRTRAANRRPGPVEGLDPARTKVLEKLQFQPVHVDALARDTGIPSRDLNGILLDLEMRGLVQQAPGHCYFKV